jgi:hypothetical protein
LQIDLKDTNLNVPSLANEICLSTGITYSLSITEDFSSRLIIEILFHSTFCLFVCLFVLLGTELRTSLLARQVLYHLSHASSPFLL